MIFSNFLNFIRGRKSIVDDYEPVYKTIERSRILIQKSHILLTRQLSKDIVKTVIDTALMKLHTQ